MPYITDVYEDVLIVLEDGDHIVLVDGKPAVHFERLTIEHDSPEPLPQFTGPITFNRIVTSAEQEYEFRLVCDSYESLLREYGALRTRHRELAVRYDDLSVELEERGEKVAEQASLIRALNAELARRQEFIEQKRAERNTWRETAQATAEDASRLNRELLEARGEIGDLKTQVQHLEGLLEAAQWEHSRTCEEYDGLLHEATEGVDPLEPKSYYDALVEGLVSDVELPGMWEGSDFLGDFRGGETEQPEAKADDSKRVEIHFHAQPPRGIGDSVHALMLRSPRWL